MCDIARKIWQGSQDASLWVPRHILGRMCLTRCLEWKKDLAESNILSYNQNMHVKQLTWGPAQKVGVVSQYSCTCVSCMLCNTSSSSRALCRPRPMTRLARAGSLGVSMSERGVASSSNDMS